MSIRIGVLDIQGSVKEHLAALEKLGLKPVSVKTKKDLNDVFGLIIPGGESTTIGKLLKLSDLFGEIYKRVKLKSLTVWGSCAGAILLAKIIRNRPPKNFGVMDIEIERNAYGRQMDSFETKISVPILGKKELSAVFIRAPKISATSRTVKILSQYAGRPVMVEEENMLATTFHPELTDDLRVHQYFFTFTKTYASKKS